VNSTAVADRLAQLAAPATAFVDRGSQQLLPVPGPLVDLFPDGGLRRGSVVAVLGSTSLLIALLASVTAAGSWGAVVGLPTLGAVAAAEAGAVLERLALVPHPGADGATILAAMLDGVDLVVAGTPQTLPLADSRRLAARARQRGAVLLGAGPWVGADVRLEATGSRWYGLGAGHGHLQARELTVEAAGRGRAARPRRCTLRLVAGRVVDGPARAAAGGGTAVALPARPLRAV